MPKVWSKVPMLLDRPLDHQMGLPNQVPLQVGLDRFQKKTHKENFPQKENQEESLPKSQVQVEIQAEVQTEVQAEVLPKVQEVLLEKIRQEKIQKVLLDRPMVSQVGVQVGLPNQVLIPMMPTPTLNR